MIRIIVGLLVIFIVACSEIKPKDNEPPLSWNHCYRSFERHVLEVSGKEVKNCGFFTISSPESSKKEARECLKRQTQEGLSFRVGHQSFGDDSMFCDVAIKDKKGTYWSFFYDSDVSGGGGGPATIWVSECSGIELKPGTIGRDSFFNLTNCKQRKDIVSKLLAK